MLDLVLGGKTQGEFATYMAQNKLTVEAMRPIEGKNGAYVTIYKGGPRDKASSYKNIPLAVNAGTLRRDEWKLLDDAVMKISETRLGGAADLESRGLVYPLGNAMGTTVLEWHDVSDMGEADMTMSGISRSKGDRPEFGHNYLPIPIIHFDYQINLRELEVSRRMGNALDTTFAERAARKCMEKLESIFFTNTTFSYGETDSRSRNTIYSYLSHPDRIQVTLSQDWDASGKTALEIYNDVKGMKQQSINNYHYGPWVLYIPTAYETIVDDDYDTNGQSTQTIRDRILKINGIQDVKVVDTLTANNVLLVQTTSDVVRLVKGMGLTNVEWETEGKFIRKYKVMTIQVPQIRSDQNSKTGIVHLA